MDDTGTCDNSAINIDCTLTQCTPDSPSAYDGTDNQLLASSRPFDKYSVSRMLLWERTVYVCSLEIVMSTAYHIPKLTDA